MIAEEEEGGEFSRPPQHNEGFSHVHSGRECQEQLTHVSRKANLTATCNV